MIFPDRFPRFEVFQYVSVCSKQVEVRGERVEQVDLQGLSDWVNQVARRLLEAVSIDDWFNGQWPDSTVCNSLG